MVQDQVVTVGVQHLRDRRAEAAGSAGDECNGTRFAHRSVPALRLSCALLPHSRPHVRIAPA